MPMKTHVRRSRFGLALAGLVAVGLLAATAAHRAEAMFIPPTDVPVDRLAKNVRAYVEANPEDAHGWYVLARIHSLALILKRHAVAVYAAQKEGDLPRVDHQFHREGAEEPPTPEALREHLRQAVEAFEKALALAPNDAKVELGLAYTLEAGAGVAVDGPPGTATAEPTEEEAARLAALVEQLGADEQAQREAAEHALAAAGARALPALRANLLSADPERRQRVRRLIGRLWKEASLAHYQRAYDLAIEDDLALPSLPIQGIQALVAHEAGTSWLRLVDERGVRPDEETTAARIRTGIAKLREKRQMAITPIVFPLDEPRALPTLLTPARHVPFDLDGDGVVERWPWVRGDTAILVWDPAGEGRITSGRQLFGSVTWWMFWANGYRALDALDDDRDGRVQGDELEGLAAWCDRNANGVSEPGEVRPLADLGIVALETNPTTEVQGGPAHPTGVRLQDGRTLPSYDWVVKPAAR